MGKGDKKSRRGKIFRGSFGVRRKRKTTGYHPVTAHSTASRMDSPEPREAIVDNPIELNEVVLTEPIPAQKPEPKKKAAAKKEEVVTTTEKPKRKKKEVSE